MSATVAHGAFAAKSRIALGGSRRAFRVYAEMEGRDERSDDRRRASSLARYAWDSTPFYRAHYAAAGLRRSDLDDPDAFDSLPTVSKQDIRSHAPDLLASGLPAGRRLPSSTGGSTGEPLRVFHDSKAPTAALWWTAYRWWGVSPWENRAVIHRERRTPSKRRRERAEWWPTVEISLDARTMTTASMGRFAAEWNRRRPVILNGYVGGVGEFADFLRDTGTVLDPPRAVALTAAPVTRSQRAIIEAAFAAPVFDAYRSAEVPWIAAECRAHAGLHVLPTRHLEVTPEGAVLVTDLGNRVFPLVRYELGDHTSLLDGVCACGNHRPRIEAVQGRVSDVIRLPNGQRITGGLTGLFNAHPLAVRRFQVHQLADHSITLRVVAGEAADAESVIAEVADSIRSLVQRTVDVRVERVAVIPHEGGKDRVVRSDVQAEGARA